MEDDVPPSPSAPKEEERKSEVDEVIVKFRSAGPKRHRMLTFVSCSCLCGMPPKSI